MNTSVSISALVVAGAFIAFLYACASLTEAPDPRMVAQEIAAARAEEAALVRAAIADPKRMERFIELISERDNLIERSSAAVEIHRAKMTALNADYRTERGAFEAQLAKYNQTRGELQTEFVDVIHAMKQTTTPDEWRVISKFQSNRLDLRQLSYGVAREGA